MTQGRGWGRPAAAAGVLAAVAGVAAFAWRTDAVQVRVAEHRLKAATTDDDRTRAADRLAALGDAGAARLLGLLRDGDHATAAAAAGGLERHVAALPAGDPRAALVAGQVLDAFTVCGEPGRAAVLGLLPGLLARDGAVAAGRGKDVVAAGLGSPDPTARVLAVRLAMHPLVDMRAAVVPLLKATEAEVRRAALFAVGPATDDDPVVADEDLFRHLHDPDDGVRRGCLDALASRGRTDFEIRLGRRLTHPDAGERLKLAADLRWDEDEVRDPEPWLERLSRDAEPAVRAAAARVAAERQVGAAPWVARLADADPDLTVRRVAGFYRSQLFPVRQVGGP